MEHISIISHNFDYFISSDHAINHYFSATITYFKQFPPLTNHVIHDSYIMFIFHITLYWPQVHCLFIQKGENLCEGHIMKCAQTMF